MVRTFSRGVNLIMASMELWPKRSLTSNENH